MLDNEIKTNDLTRFEKFKKWAKENLLSLSTAAIAAAGIIITTVIAGRKAIKTGAKATSKFAKAVANVGRKVAPLLGAVLNLLGNILSFGAKGLNWLAKNFWMLAIAITYIAYNEISKRRR